MADDGHEVGAEDAEAVVEAGILDMHFLDQVHRIARPGDDVVDVLEQFIALGDGQRLVHAARHRPGAMHALAGGDADHFLPELAQQHAAPGDFRVRGGDADDIALGDVAVESEQQVRRAQVEEVQRMRLQHLAIVHQAAEFLGGRRQLFGADDDVERLRGGQVVRYRADAAQALDHDRHFPVWATLDEFLEAAELDDVQAHLMHLVLLVEQDGDLAVALDARHGIDRDAAQLFGMFGGFKLVSHFPPQS